MKRTIERMMKITLFATALLVNVCLMGCNEESADETTNVTTENNSTEKMESTEEIKMEGSHDSDVEILKKIFEEQRNNGVYMPDDITDSRYYQWNEEGRLTSVNISCGVSGHLSLEGLTALKDLDCAVNELESLNVSGCISLENLQCDYNKLTNLNVSGWLKRIVKKSTYRYLL